MSSTSSENADSIEPAAAADEVAKDGSEASEVVRERSPSSDTGKSGFSHYQLLLSALHSFSWKSYYWQDGGSPDSLLERSVEVRVQGQWGENSRAGGIGLKGLEGGGSPGGGGGGKPNTEST